MPPRPMGAFVVGAAVGSAAGQRNARPSTTTYIVKETTSAPPTYGSTAPPPSVSGPMPEGWEERKDGQGRTYYVNHVAKTTQWEDPRILPAGWEERKDATGRTYYVNHNTKSTQWEDPRRATAYPSQSVMVQQAMYAPQPNASTPLVQNQAQAPPPDNSKGCCSSCTVM
eukprot:TRINITY_DN3766_c0_g1::TRINITY_DN3766_c0_g1_i1::g.24065::m.24065 TRINITY_DN3766_c0_g1::TRINITY_DN3766_c0_g1_i1::g.24065  ORF type:complete len:169 (+),score=13.36,sp/Q8BZZ3/WWP1_MOUSE/51.19/2e-19,sp/Q8BZZ3/WWP1_MOUSE/52.05/5e-17,sp/Q8BZZ3/WWP1_MOUSE/37.38/4e-15,WW/PF00397.21/4.4e-12,WW/PF00397.21/2.3e-14 TRINITY_DN3766_c0_g1_i1:119-625(+)